MDRLKQMNWNKGVVHTFTQAFKYSINLTLRLAFKVKTDPKTNKAGLQIYLHLKQVNYYLNF